MKVLAVTGGAQGIGRAVALHFAAAGHAVSVADSAADAGAENLGLLRERGVPALVRATD
jgi:NAD(P)-dependent dehydrogenase (short-subunit alcohol dehydrogenase family)